MSKTTADSAKYTMPYALGGLEAILGKQECRRWVLGEVIALGYEPGLHAPYDHLMLHIFGPGRGRARWAERIGKKYQRIALARLIGKLDDVARRTGVSTEGPGAHLRDLDCSSDSGVGTVRMLGGSKGA